MLGVALSLGSLPAHAQNTSVFEVTNYTYSAGDPTNDVTDDVLLTNLVLTENFQNGTTRVDPLFDTSHNAQTSVDALNGTNTDPFLDSGLVFLQPGSSPLVAATLTGQIVPPSAADANGNYTIHTQTNAFDPSTAGTATVGPNFSATLTQFTPGSFVEIYAQNPDGTNSTHGLGTLAIVPEPSLPCVFLLGAAVVGLSLVLRRKMAISH